MNTVIIRVITPLHGYLIKIAQLNITPVTGGGANNQYLMSRIKKLVDCKIILFPFGVW